MRTPYELQREVTSQQIPYYTASHYLKIPKPTEDEYNTAEQQSEDLVTEDVVTAITDIRRYNGCRKYYRSMKDTCSTCHTTTRKTCTIANIQCASGKNMVMFESCIEKLPGYTDDMHDIEQYLFEKLFEKKISYNTGRNNVV